MNKNTINIVLALLLLVFSGAFIYLYNSNRNKTNTIKSILTLNKHKDDIISIYRDKYNSEWAKVKQLQISREAAQIELKPQLDDIHRRTGIKTNRITGITTASFSKAGDFKSSVQEKKSGDTVYLAFGFGDSHFNETAEIHDSIVTGHYVYRDTVEFVRHWDRNWFLGAETIYMDGRLSDTSAHIEGLTNIEIGDHYSRWGISAYTGFDFINRKLGAGLCLNYNIIRFKKRLH